jgi:hypothetical protein
MPTMPNGDGELSKAEKRARNMKTAMAHLDVLEAAAIQSKKREKELLRQYETANARSKEIAAKNAQLEAAMNA